MGDDIKAKPRKWQLIEQAKYKLQQRNFRKAVKKGFVFP